MNPISALTGATTDRILDDDPGARLCERRDAGSQGHR